MLIKTSTFVLIQALIICSVVGGDSDEDYDVIGNIRVPVRFQGKNLAKSFHAFILHGSPAYIEDYPFKLSLRMLGEFFCGASVISAEWSLTAAHCLESGVSPELISVYGGSSNRLEGGMEFRVDRYELHPDYNPIIFDYDVAVLKIKGSFFDHGSIRPTKLANEQCKTYQGTRIRLAGWGYNEQMVLPEELHEIEQYIIHNDLCYDEWGGDITSRMLCAAVEDNVDSCNGDSGGAVLKGCLQVGIISFGSLECGSPIPSVFSRIEDPAIRRFIKRTTNV